MKNLKYTIYKILEKSTRENLIGLVFDYFIIILIFLNVTAVILETVPAIEKSLKSFFYIFELFSVIVFTLEYLARVYSITSEKKYSHPIKGRIQYIFSFMAIVDLLAILPFYLPFLIKVDMRFLRALRLLRFLRILKIGRYSESIQLLGSVVKSKREELTITFYVLFILLIIASSLMYYFEHAAQPQNFSSIPAAMWWGIATLTTVGYGDIYPITVLGKLTGAIIAVLGIGIFALPAGIIASGLIEQIQHKNEKKYSSPQYCPHCGKKIPSIQVEDYDTDPS